MNNLGLKPFMVFSKGGESQAVFCSKINEAEAYAEEFAKEDGVTFVAIYTYHSHAEVKGLVWHLAEPVALNGAEPKNNRKRWSESDQATIINCVKAGCSTEDIAKELNRSKQSIACRISYLKNVGRIKR